MEKQPTAEQIETWDNVRQGVRLGLARKHGWICWYCGEKITLQTCHVDHIVPRCRGGSSKTWNLALSCAFCNRAKWDNTLEDFLAWLRRPHASIVEMHERAKNPETQWRDYGEDIQKGLRKPTTRRGTKKVWKF